jgi:hypothetical protein
MVLQERRCLYQSQSVVATLGSLLDSLLASHAWQPRMAGLVSGPGHAIEDVSMTSSPIVQHPRHGSDRVDGSQPRLATLAVSLLGQAGVEGLHDVRRAPPAVHVSHDELVHHAVPERTRHKRTQCFGLGAAPHTKYQNKRPKANGSMLWQTKATIKLCPKTAFAQNRVCPDQTALQTAFHTAFQITHTPPPPLPCLTSRCCC